MVTANTKDIVASDGTRGHEGGGGGGGGGMVIKGPPTQRALDELTSSLEAVTRERDEARRRVALLVVADGPAYEDLYLDDDGNILPSSVEEARVEAASIWSSEVAWDLFPRGPSGGTIELTGGGVGIDPDYSPTGRTTLIPGGDAASSKGGGA